MNVWNKGTETESLYYTHDLQKNVTALFGRSAGRRAQYEYDPYGNPINTDGDAAGINPYRYSSEYLDEDLGLIYYNYRHYNFTDGRWINRDPIQEEGGRNLYGFVGNRAGWFGDWLGFFEPHKQKEYCLEALTQLMSSIGRALKELLKYDPMRDARGGFQSPHTGKLTQPGGHYEKLTIQIKNSLRKRMKNVRRLCSDDNGNLPPNASVLCEDGAAALDLIKEAPAPELLLQYYNITYYILDDMNIKVAAAIEYQNIEVHRAYISHLKKLEEEAKKLEEEAKELKRQERMEQVLRYHENMCKNPPIFVPIGGALPLLNRGWQILRGAALLLN